MQPKLGEFTYSGFRGTELNVVLRSLGVTTVVICGLGTIRRQEGV